MKSLEDIKKLKDQFKVFIESEKPTGGQSCGIIPNTIIGKHEELKIEIKIGTYRQQYKNRALLQTIFDLIFDDLVKETQL